jgi:hypothetical protein
MRNPIPLTLKSLPDGNENQEAYLKIDYIDNRLGDKYNECAIRITTEEGWAAYPIHIEATDAGGNPIDFIAHDVTIRVSGVLERACFIDSLAAILKGYKVINALDKE